MPTEDDSFDEEQSVENARLKREEKIAAQEELEETIARSRALCADWQREDEKRTGLLSLPDDLLLQIFDLAYEELNLYGGIRPPFDFLGMRFRRAALCRRLYPIVKAALTRRLTLGVYVESAVADLEAALQRKFFRGPFMRPPLCKGYVRHLILTYNNKLSGKQIRAAATETLLVIGQFPSLQSVELKLGNLDIAETRLFLDELALPAETSFTIKLSIDVCRNFQTDSDAPTADPGLNLDNLHQYKVLYPLLTSLDLDYTTRFSGRCKGLSIQLYGRTYSRFSVYGVTMESRDDHPEKLQVTRLDLHISGELFLAPSTLPRLFGMSGLSTPGQIPDLDIFADCPHLTTLELDLEHMNLKHWKRLTTVIPDSVTTLRLEGREVEDWTYDNIDYPGDDEDSPTLMNISALRHLNQLPLKSIRTNWIFFNASTGAFNTDVLPPTLESLDFVSVGQFPLSRFTDWLADNESLTKLTSLSFDFIDSSVFPLAIIAELSVTCAQHTPEIQLDLSSDNELRAEGSGYATTSDEEGSEEL